jgi:hypothetical protein
MKKHAQYSIFESEINTARVEAGVFKSATNRSFTIQFKFYYYPKDLETFNQKIAISQLRRHLILNLPKSIKRHIFTHTFPDVPHFYTNKSLNGCYTEVELMCWTNEFIPNIKDNKLFEMVCEISSQFDKFAQTNMHININKFSK